MIPAILDQLSQSSRKVLFLFDLPANKFQLLSQAFETVWEESREAVMDKPQQLLHRIHPDDRDAVLGRLERLLRGEACDLSVSLLLADGSTREVGIDAHPIRNESNAVVAVAGMAEDISREAQYLNYLLEFGQKKDNVLQVVAHDLQGPLAIVKGVVALLNMDHESRNYEELSTYTGIIMRAYDDCLKLITEVLRDEHIRSVSTAVKRERFNVVSKVREVAEGYLKSIVIETKIEVQSTEEKIMALLDDMKLTQILNNLISNSIKFTPPEGKITITVSRQGKQVLITHADTGIGIPRDLQPYLFMKNNNKAMRPGLKGEKPNGIGLSIIRDLVELQGGSIRFESEENQGTTFYLTFPLLD